MKTATRYQVRDCGHDTPCWVWTLALSAAGYASVVLRNPRRRVYAHRYYFEMAKGPIPDGHDLDHLCRNRACVNPAHLEPVLRCENARRGAKAKLTATQAASIKERRGAGEAALALAEEFGVTRTQIYYIAKGKSWGLPGTRAKTARVRRA